MMQALKMHTRYHSKFLDSTPLLAPHRTSPRNQLRTCGKVRKSPYPVSITKNSDSGIKRLHTVSCRKQDTIQTYVNVSAVRSFISRAAEAVKGAWALTPKRKLNTALDTKKIASLLHEGHFATSHGGSVDPMLPMQSVELFIRDKGNHYSGSTIEFPLTEETEENLLSRCYPLKCGVNDKEVYEPKYRKALGLDSDSFFHNFELQSTTVLEDIRAALWPHNDIVLTAHLDKLSVYTAGGFFKDHTDYTRSQNYFGTLVLVLPSTFEGGELVVNGTESGGKSVTYDWPDKSK